MRAAVIKSFGGTEVFEFRQMPTPSPGTCELLVRVRATSINPLDCQIRRGDYKEQVELPVVLGHDVSGVVEAVGSGVRDFVVGDEVFYTPRIFAGPGSYAQYHVVDAAIAAQKPASLSHAQAAAVPLAGGTAWDALVVRAALQVGESVLVHAGSGGVGSFAVQLARAMGARVLSTASAANADFVRELGAEAVFDYRTRHWVEAVLDSTGGRGVDVVFDTVGGLTLSESPRALRPFGRLVSIVDTAEPQVLLAAYEKNLSFHFLFAPQYRTKLDRLSGLIEQGVIAPVIDSSYRFEDIPRAHQRLEGGGVRGKVVVEMQ